MKKSRKILGIVLALSMVITPFPGESSVASAAKKPVLNKTKLSITVGKKSTLKVKNKIKGSAYTWKSSKTKVATVTKSGVVKGIKAGSATVTCKVKTKATKKTKSKTYTLKCKVTVKKKATTKATATPTTKPTTAPTAEPTVEPTTEPTIAPTVEPTVEPTAEPTIEPTIAPTAEPTANPDVLTVATQKDLESALKAPETRSLTLETTAEEAFTIPAGEYKNIDLIVDTPNADIENNGTFKSITIKAIKGSTWTEKAQGNIIMVIAAVAHINIIKEAKVEKIVYVKTETQINATLTINEGGVVENVVVQTGTKLTVNGDATTAVPVSVENTANNAEITSTVPINLETANGIKVTLEKGAENSTIKTTTDVFVQIQNETTTSVTVTKASGVTQTVSSGTSTTVSNTSSGSTVVRPSTTATPAPTATPTPEEPSTPEIDIACLNIESGWTAGWTPSKAVNETAFNSYTTEWLVGKRIAIAYTVDADTGWTNWGVYAGADQYTIRDTNDGGIGGTSYTFDITEEVAEKLLSGGLYIAADHATIDSVSIGIALQVESWTTTEDWNPAKVVSESTFNNYTAEWLTGKKINFTYTLGADGYTNLGVYAGADQYTIRDTNDGGIGGTGYTFDITKEIAEKLLNGGLYVMADLATSIDSVTILPSINSSTPEEPTTPEMDIAYLNIESDWTTGWESSKAVSETAFNSYTSEWLVDKRITIAYTVDADTGWTNWGVYAGADQYTIRDTNDGGISGTSYTFGITEEIAEKLLNGGLYIAADHATIDSVSIGIALQVESWTTTADWNPAKAVSESTFYNYTAEWLTGKKINFTYTLGENSYTNLGVYAGTEQYTIRDTNDGGIGGTGYTFDITEEIAKKLINGGLYIMADLAISIDSVTILPSSSD